MREQAVDSEYQGLGQPPEARRGGARSPSEAPKPPCGHLSSRHGGVSLCCFKLPNTAWPEGLSLQVGWQGGRQDQ